MTPRYEVAAVTGARIQVVPGRSADQQHDAAVEAHMIAENPCAFVLLTAQPLTEWVNNVIVSE